MTDIVDWDSEPPEESPAELEFVEAFDARGMRRVYGRGDHFGRRAALNMDIWRDRRGHLFVRFWSRSQEDDMYSYRLIGLPNDAIPVRAKKDGFTDAWLPRVLREEYESWILSEL